MTGIVRRGVPGINGLVAPTGGFIAPSMLRQQNDAVESARGRGIIGVGGHAQEIGDASAIVPGAKVGRELDHVLVVRLS